MRKIWALLKNSVIFVWVLLVVVAAIVITMDNPEPAQLHLFTWQVDLSLGILFFAILFLGLLAGLLPCIFSLFWCRRKNALLQSKLKKLQQELENTRKVSSQSQIE